MARLQSYTRTTCYPHLRHIAFHTHLILVLKSLQEMQCTQKLVPRQNRQITLRRYLVACLSRLGWLYY